MVTSSGNLACNYIVHVVGKAQPAEISACVQDALQQCERLNIASVALPAIGTGKSNWIVFGPQELPSIHTLA